MSEYYDYLSKSRIKTWVKCPRKFYYKYILGIETEETESMIRGKDVHEAIEEYYYNLQEYCEENGEPPETLLELLDNNTNWREYLNPYISHFIGFERKRLSNIENGNIDDWVPVGVEEEAWNEIYEDAPPLMGYTDVLIPAESFPDDYIGENEGYILVDFKTGEPRSDSYRSIEEAGVNLDLAYYGLLFEDEYDITAVAGYYLKTDTVVSSNIDQARREFIEEVVSEISRSDEDDIEDYPIETSPLCAWGESENEMCPFYERCDSNWKKPVNNKEDTIQMIKKGKSNEEIAEHYDVSEESIDYWIRNQEWYVYRN